MERMTAQEFANIFSNFVNTYSFGSGNDEFVEHFKRQHNTLQASMIRLMLTAIEAMAKGDMYIDGRNQSAHETCKKVIEGYKQMIAKDFEEQKGGSYKSDLDYVASDHCLPSKYIGFV
jgi:predicted kinase